MRSFFRMSKADGGYFNADEAGFDELAALAALVSTPEAEGGLGQSLVVVDADDLLADPPGVLRTWCDAVGLPYDGGRPTLQPGA